VTSPGPSGVTVSSQVFPSVAASGELRRSVVRAGHAREPCARRCLAAFGGRVGCRAERHIHGAAGRGGQQAVGRPPVRAAQHQPVRHLALRADELLAIDLEDEVGVQRGAQAQVEAAGDLGEHHDLVGRAVDVEAIRRQRSQPRPERITGRPVGRRHVQRCRPHLDEVRARVGTGIRARVGASAGIGASADQRLRAGVDAGTGWRFCRGTADGLSHRLGQLELQPVPHGTLGLHPHQVGARRQGQAESLIRTPELGARTQQLAPGAFYEHIRVGRQPPQHHLHRFRRGQLEPVPLHSAGRIVNGAVDDRLGLIGDVAQLRGLGDVTEVQLWRRPYRHGRWYQQARDQRRHHGTSRGWPEPPPTQQFP